MINCGTTFLDEFNEFPRSVLEALRQPVEDGRITISRSRERVTYPSRFMLVASANPCPCGFLNHPKKACNCTPCEIHKYHKRVSGPIIDRIDLHVDTPDVDVQELSQDASAEKFLESSGFIQSRVTEARNIQEKRFVPLRGISRSETIHTNAEMKNAHIKKYCTLSGEAEGILMRAAQGFQLSARSYYKVIKVARTIADIEKADGIAPEHIAEALQYRPKVYGAA